MNEPTGENREKTVDTRVDGAQDEDPFGLATTGDNPTLEAEDDPFGMLLHQPEAAVTTSEDFSEKLATAQIPRDEREAAFYEAVANITAPEFAELGSAAQELAHLFIAAQTAEGPEATDISDELELALTEAGLGGFVNSVASLAQVDEGGRTQAITWLRNRMAEELDKTKRLALAKDVDPSSMDVKNEVDQVLTARQELPRQTVLFLEAALHCFEQGQYNEGVNFIILAHPHCSTAAEFPPWVADDLVALFGNIDLRANDKARSALIRLWNASSSLFIGNWYQDARGIDVPKLPIERFANQICEAQRVEEQLQAEAAEQRDKEKYRRNLSEGYQGEFDAMRLAVQKATQQALSPRGGGNKTMPEAGLGVLRDLAVDMREVSKDYNDKSLDGPEGYLKLVSLVLQDPDTFNQAVLLTSGQGKSSRQFREVVSDFGNKRFGERGDLSPDQERWRKQFIVLVEAYGVLSGIMMECLQVLSQEMKGDSRYDPSPESKSRAQRLLFESLKILSLSAGEGVTNGAQQFDRDQTDMRYSPHTAGEVMLPILSLDARSGIPELSLLKAAAEEMSQAVLATDRETKRDQMRELDGETKDKIGKEYRRLQAILSENAVKADASASAERATNSEKVAAQRAELRQIQEQNKLDLEAATVKMSVVEQALTDSAQLQEAFKVLATYTHDTDPEALARRFLTLDSSQNPPVSLIKQTTLEGDSPDLKAENRVNTDLGQKLQQLLTALLSKDDIVTPIRGGLLNRKTTFQINSTTAATFVRSRREFDLPSENPQWQVAGELRPGVFATALGMRSTSRLTEWAAARSTQSLDDLRADFDALKKAMDADEGSSLTGQLTAARQAQESLKTLTARLNLLARDLAAEVSSNKDIYDLRIAQQALTILSRRISLNLYEARRQ